MEYDSEEIIQAGVKLKLDSPNIGIGELFDQKFDAVFLATGSTFVGTPAFWLKEEGIEPTLWGSIKVAPNTLATSREGVFAGGDAVLGGISEDFIGSIGSGNEKNFFKLLVDRLALYRGDSSRSCIRAIASGRKAAEAIDRYIKGAMNLHRELEEQLEVQEKARYFMYQEEPMYTKRESELLQQYIAQHGQMPEGNRELEDLF